MKIRDTRRLSYSLLAALTVVLLVPIAVSAKPPAAPKADLAISMTDSPDPARTDETVTYSIFISNTGPSGASGVSVIDRYPSEAQVLSATSSRGSCSVAAEVTCSIGSVSSTEIVEITVEVRSSAAGTLVNTASVSGAESDPSRANNTASTSTEIYECFRCPTLTISATPDPATAGEIIVYRTEGHFQSQMLRALEMGSRTVMCLPEHTEYVASVIEFVGGRCSYADRTVTCYGSTQPHVDIVIRTLRAGDLKTEVAMYVNGLSQPSTTASTVTKVAPARAPGTDSPVAGPAEDAQSEVEEKAGDIARQVPPVPPLPPTPPIPVNDALAEVERIRESIPFMPDCVLYMMEPCAPDIWAVYNFVWATADSLTIPPTP